MKLSSPLILVLALLLTSCGTAIKITGIDTTGHNLLLSVGGHTINLPASTPIPVPAGHDIVWNLPDVMQVQALKGIADKGNGQGVSGREFFEELPAATDASNKKWKAKIKPGLPAGTKYYYNILWQAPGDTTVRVFDPVISIRPRS